MLRLTTYFVRSAVLHQHPSSIVGLDHSLIKLSAAKNSFILTKNRFVHRRATNFAEPGCLHRCSSKQYDLKNNCTKFDVQTKSFHTSSRNEIHPLLWALAKPVAKLASVISGRTFRKWWQKLTPEQKSHYKFQFQARRYIWAALVSLLGLGAVGHYFTHIQETPISKRRRYIGITQKQFLKIAEFESEMQMKTVEENILPSNHPAYKRVQSIIQRIVNSNQDLDFLQNQTWTIVVVNSEECNAFVLPTGHIFVFTGMLKMAATENQLAFVLGHEMAHALLGHGAEQVSFATVLDVLIIIVMAAIWALMPTDGIAIVTDWFYNKVMHLMLNLPYSRMLEQEADQVGLHLVAKACFDVRESSTFWRTMSIMTELHDDVEVPQWISTHPSHQNRAKILDDSIPEAIELRRLCNCPSLPAQDPNENLKHLQQLLLEKKKLNSGKVV